MASPATAEIPADWASEVGIRIATLDSRFIWIVFILAVAYQYRRLWRAKNLSLVQMTLAPSVLGAAIWGLFLGVKTLAVFLLLKSLDEIAKNVDPNDIRGNGVIAGVVAVSTGLFGLWLILAGREDQERKTLYAYAKGATQKSLRGTIALHGTVIHVTHDVDAETGELIIPTDKVSAAGVQLNEQIPLWRKPPPQ